MQNLELIDELIKFSHLAYRRGFVEAAGGNISAKLEDEQVLISPSGVSLRDVSRKNLMIVDRGGEKIKGPESLKPSKEVGMHLAVYRLRPEIRAILHSHPPFSTSFAVKQISIKMVTSSSRLKLKDVPLISFAPPGSKELTNATEQALKNSDSGINSLLLAKHGLIAFGKNLAQAFDTTDLVERTAYLNFILNNLQ